MFKENEMTLEEMRKGIGEDGLSKITDNYKVYIDMDRSCVTVGLPKSYSYGMRMKRSYEPYDYYSFSDLLKDKPAFFVSDGYFEGNYMPKGNTIQLAIDIGDWDVAVSDKIMAELVEGGYVA